MKTKSDVTWNEYLDFPVMCLYGVVTELKKVFAFASKQLDPKTKLLTNTNLHSIVRSIAVLNLVAPVLSHPATTAYIII